ncbi:MAG: hypothetical protein ACLTS6_17550 [Anaerobutyricum sp.]
MISVCMRQALRDFYEEQTGYIILTTANYFETGVDETSGIILPESRWTDGGNGTYDCVRSSLKRSCCL